MKRNKLAKAQIVSSLTEEQQNKALPVFEFNIEDIPVEPSKCALPKTVLPLEILAPYAILRRR